MFHTAGIAGGTEWGKEWLATRIRRTRLEELVKHQERMKKHQIVDLADEAASARRTLKDLTGETSKEEMKREMVRGKYRLKDRSTESYIDTRQIKIDLVKKCVNICI